MKLYKHITRFQYRRFFSKGSYDYKFILWAKSLKPGDVVATCQGFNSRIKTITPEKYHSANWFDKCPNVRSDAWWIYEFKIVDTNDNWHFAPGGGCVFPRESIDQIKSFWLSYTEEYMQKQEELGWNQSFNRAMVQAFQNGYPVVDEDGILLPEFIEMRRALSDACQTK